MTEKKSITDVENYVKNITKRNNWTLNKDPETFDSLVEGLQINFNRLGYFNCPCRDSENNNRLDNRKNNLRFVTFNENARNAGMKSNNTSGYIGVSKYKNKWLSRICFNKEIIHLGYFKEKEDAIQARKEAEIKYFGEYRYDYNGGDA